LPHSWREIHLGIGAFAPGDPAQLSNEGNRCDQGWILKDAYLLNAFFDDFGTLLNLVMSQRLFSMVSLSHAWLVSTLQKPPLQRKL
jgi:hypothetical protein